MADDYDYVITGAGSAGCVLANRLTEDPSVRVALIEAGGLDRHVLFHWPAGFAKMTKGIASWGWSTVPQRHMQGRVLWYTQAKVIGGGSTINAQIYTRGHAKDYDEWASIAGATGWSHADVLPYFKRAEDNERFVDRYHATGGPLGVSNPVAALPVCDAFIRAGQEFGLPYNPDFNGAEQVGVGFYQLTQRNRRRSSTATAYLRPALSHPNLTVLTSTHVDRILVEGGRATGVVVRQGKSAEQKTIRAAREVLVTSGAIGSPRLLMLSGIGPADHLTDLGIKVAHDSPHVGANLQDHVDLSVIAECTGDHSYDGMKNPIRAALAGLQYLALKSGPVASSLFETGGFGFADPAARSPDIQFHLGQGSGIEKGIDKLDNAGITLNSAYLRPRSRGSVRLASGNPDAAPLIDPNYWAEPEDRILSLRGLEMAREIIAQPALKAFVKREVVPGRLSETEMFDYACRVAKTDHHPVGTCAMGSGPDSVLDPDLRLRGIEGLRVCDAAAMPLIPSSNTNAPTIMLAEKAADIIRGLTPLRNG